MKKLKMWNYRIVRTAEDEENPFFEISEVYYDPIGKPLGYCKATVGGDTAEDIKDTLTMMALALTKPILKSKDFK